jgi:hypothetical protein
MGVLLTLVRLVVFSAVSFLAFITLILAADVQHQFSNNFVYISLPSAGLAIATSVFTLISLPILLFLGFKRDGAVPSYIIIELGWSFFLMILWLAVGAESAAEAPGLDLIGTNYNVVYDPNNPEGATVTYSCGRFCSEAKAVEAFGFLNWLMLLGYLGILSFHAVKAHQAGHTRVWYSSAKQLESGQIPPAHTGGLPMHEKHPTTTAPMA